ncbi:MAG: TonB-dependent receptor, partial [Bacteroidales bacterium]|nr:TonB-dependent receptor [Bacteroidales bacterium]
MWRSSIGNQGFYNFVDGTSTGSYVTGMMPTTLGNPDLTWETSEQTDLGIDVRLFNDKVTLTADYYWKKTKDLIVNGATPSLVVGNTASPINGGSVINRGLEIDLSYRGKIGEDFNYSLSGNIATLHNEVTYVSEFVSGKLPGASMNTYTELTMFEAGHPVWYFNGYKFTGLNPENGYPEFEDLNGDGSISAADKTYIGSAVPDFTYGLTFSANWKNFDLVVFGTGSHGNKIYQWLSRPDNPGSNILQSAFDNRWTPSNHNGTYPAANTPNDLLANYTFSSANVK